MSLAALLFYALGGLAVVAALAMIASRRSPVTPVLALVVTTVALAGIFVVLEAHFVAAVQIIVFAGAILVLFLFVVMLLHGEPPELAPGRRRVLQVAGAVVGVAALVHVLRRLHPGETPLPSLPIGFGGHRAIGFALYTDYLIVVELVSLLLLAAIVGALILAKPGRDGQREDEGAS